MLDRTLRIGSLADNLALALVLFEDLSVTAPHFHPHPLTQEFINNYEQKSDVYDLAIDPESGLALAYGLLRGWDAGYDVPSLGIAVRSTCRGYGVGRMMIKHLHEAARLRGAELVRLRVHAANHKAIRLYSSLGYAWLPDLEDGQIVGVYTLSKFTL